LVRSAVTMNDPVGALAFYRIFFPVLVQVLLVGVPALWGMRHALTTMFPHAVRRMLWAGAGLALTAMVLENQWRFLVLLYALHAIHGSQPPLDHIPAPSLIWHGWPERVLQAVVYWPLLYFLAVAMAHRVRNSQVSSGPIC
jgi:hypothetical protein